MPKNLVHRWRIRQRHLIRRMLGQASPERTARGLAAGFFAAAFPLPGLQIPLSLFCAWVVRGNKAVAILPQFLSNAGTMVPLAFAQFRIGSWLWPGAEACSEHVMTDLKAAATLWTWSAPLESASQLIAALASMGAGVLGPMVIGIVLSALVLAAISYPLALIVITGLHLRRLRRREMRGIGRRPRAPLLLPQTAGMPSVQTSDAYVLHPERFVTADGVTLLEDGRQAYPEMLRCISRARQSVSMETYILRADQTGRRFAKELCAAAARGVKVRLLYDGIGALGLPHEFVHTLLKAGVRTAVYRPLSSFWRRGLARLHRRDHRKILVIDDRIGFTGGLNIGDDYAARDEGGGGWRDTHVRLDGHAPARQLRSLFEDTWMAAEEHAPPAPLPAPAPFFPAANAPESPASDAGVSAASRALEYTSIHVRLQVLGNREFLQRVRVRRAYMHAIHNARRYILIENAYFIPDRGIRRALYRAVKRGVVVAVAVAMHSDVPVASMASRALYSELLAGGVRLYEYPISMLHAKAAVIDDNWAMVASYNLDHRSLLHNLEAGVMLVDRAFAAALRDQIMRDIGSCREVIPLLHCARPWSQALAESLAYQFRYWL